MPSSRARLVGVTGGIGSGKSVLCRCFRSLGRVVLSADQIANDLTGNDTELRQAIRARFGEGIYAPGGELKRKELADVVFRSAPALRDLNRIVHPAVFAAIERALSELPESSRRPYAVVEAALVFESGMDRWLDATVLVRAPLEARVARVASRDGLPREAILARISNQIPEAQALRKADFVVENGGAESALAERAAFLDRVFSHLFA